MPQRIDELQGCIPEFLLFRDAVTTDCVHRPIYLNQRLSIFILHQVVELVSASQYVIHIGTTFFVNRFN